MNNIKTLKKQDYIKVYNHSNSVVVLSFRDNIQEAVDPKDEDGNPGYSLLRWENIYWANDKSRVFKDGLLRFHKDEEEALYEELGIWNWKEILFEEVIEDIITNPTIEGLKRIIAITNGHVFSRVKSVLFDLIKDDVAISHKVLSVITERGKELLNGKRNSSIIITEKESLNPVDEKEHEALRGEVAELKALVEKLTKDKVGE